MWLDQLYHKLSPPTTYAIVTHMSIKKDLSINLFLVLPHVSCIPSLWSHFHLLGLQGTSTENVKDRARSEQKTSELKAGTEQW